MKNQVRMIKKQIKMQKGLKKMKNEYTFFSLLNEFEKIEIPRIQRSYAQGRESEKIVRDGFLGSIMKTLENKNEDRLCLDFIYGDSNNKKFIPIDGQQRLTTLYLLYWYLNNFEKNTVEKEKRKEALRKFTYETRESSKEFCERLSGTSINVEDFKNTKEEKISSKIKNQTWYLIQWKDDPTIKAMLTMLDAIEEKLKFKDIQEIKTNAFEENGKRIYFYFIEVKTFGSADELYVKMNSRGKKLTTFENFKSKLEGYMDREIFKKEEDKKTLNEFKKKIDNEWLNYFWEQIIKEEEKKRNIEEEKKRNKGKENKKNQNNEVNKENEKNNNNLQIKNIAEQIDRCLMNLFMTIFENEMALIDNKTIDEIKNIIKDYDDFILKNEDERKLDFEKLKEQNVINETTIKYSCYVLEYYSMLQNAKQDTEQNTKQDTEHDTEHDTEQELDKIINYEEIINKMMNFSGGNKNDFRPEKIQFYIICKYLYKICEKEKDKDLVDIIKEADNQNKLTKILYFARNIVKNVYIDSEEKYCKIIKFMDNIVDAFIKNNYNSIFEYLKDLDVEDLIKQYKMEEVKYLLYGEQKKAEKIYSSIEWKNEIIKMDANEYFTGNTRFIFEFVGNRRKENLNANELEEYRKYVTLINIIFSGKNNEDTESIEDIKDANIDPICNSDNYYLKRALFTIGNYMFEFSKRYSYLICSDKYQSWKKLLTGEKYGEAKDVFRKLLDKIADKYDVNNNDDNNSDDNSSRNRIKEIIKNIVETYIQDNKQPVYGVGNWREYLIRYPKLIGIVKDNTNSSKLGILKTVNNEKIDNAKDIIIIKRVNVSQTSWSFYTYALKCRIEEKYGKELGLEYQPNSNEDNKYIIYKSSRYGKISLIYGLKEDIEPLYGKYAYYIKSEKDLSSILNKGKNCGVVTLQDGKKYFFYKYAIEQTDNQTEEQKNNAAMAEQNVIDDFGKLI